MSFSWMAMALRLVAKWNEELIHIKDSAQHIRNRVTVERTSIEYENFNRNFKSLLAPLITRLILPSLFSDCYLARSSLFGPFPLSLALHVGFYRYTFIYWWFSIFLTRSRASSIFSNFASDIHSTLLASTWLLKPAKRSSEENQTSQQKTANKTIRFQDFFSTQQFALFFRSSVEPFNILFLHFFPSLFVVRLSAFTLLTRFTREIAMEMRWNTTEKGKTAEQWKLHEWEFSWKLIIENLLFSWWSFLFL